MRALKANEDDKRISLFIIKCRKVFLYLGFYLNNTYFAKQKKFGR